MSACECYCVDECMATEHGPHIARKAGFSCCYCGRPVKPGERCFDFMYFFDGDPGRGGHRRAHEVCQELRRLFADQVCGGCYTFSRWDFDEASQHAVAHGDDPYWMAWLLLYETTW